ncbi:uncharacterized protein PV09_00993 [Verruconis gallopava]|uniref:Alpha/beta hydrolase fold-3 domain-containing protein n=1 Tax=Verruconis gallopava TaxID=253628 RepID=A0A0D2AMX9_9PEZI|nr:uncharacterized protein PV09_00993 [Verruconis gallopava]KIW08048.1 hypothetical protein PV09_00993 [Verruconis gallopava]
MVFDDMRRPRASMATADIPFRQAPRPRWLLVLQARMWRFLMSIGMFLHKLARPRPPSPDFKQWVDATVSPRPGRFRLNFYVPKEWKEARRLQTNRKFPVVVNFHGGGFTLGKATDDCRWCKTVVDEVGAVVVSVDYRLAPECPFPTAVEDGADAILYLVSHANQLNLDTDNIAVSGFSSGANMCFTVPLRLLEELEMQIARGEDHRKSVILGQRPPLQKSLSEGRVLVKAKKQIRVKAVCAWYPPTDYTRTRAQRKATCARLDQQLPAVFTELFDESYLSPPTMDMSNPYLSPGVAPDYMLASMPNEIILFCCEWDMLLQEGTEFRDRLRALGKTVHYHMVPQVPHGWDKAPNPLRVTPGVREQYLKACTELKRLLVAQEPLSDVDSGFAEASFEMPDEAGISTPEQAHLSPVSSTQPFIIPEQDFRTSWFRTSWTG